MADGTVAAWALHAFVDVDLTGLTLRGEERQLKKLHIV